MATSPLGNIIVSDAPITVADTPVFGMDIKKSGQIITRLQQEKAKAEKENATLKTKIAEQDELARQYKDSAEALERSIDEKTNQINALQNNVNQLEMSLAAKEEMISELTVELETAREGTPLASRVGVKDLLQKTGEQLNKAHEILSGSESKFRLGKISFEIKGISSEDGTKVQFLEKEDLMKLPQDSLSSFHTEFLPSPGPVLVDESADITIPKIVGYTEPLARRKLEEAGFFVESSYQAVSDPRDVGRVVVQKPQQGSNLAGGSVVKITLGKQLEAD